MNELCFMSNLTSSEWASWVQAIGSVAAIIAAAGIARHQARLQHESALNLLRTERRTARLETAQTLHVLAGNSVTAMAQVTAQLEDRVALMNAGEGTHPCNIGEIQRLDTYISGIPLHELPHSLVTLTMIVASTVRQFRQKVEMALHLHRQMDGEMFDEFISTLTQMNQSIAETVKDLAREVKELNA